MKTDGKLIGSLLGLLLTRRPQGVLLGLLVGWIFDVLRNRQHAANASALAELELPPGASDAEIDFAWRRLIARHHPDRNAGSDRAAHDLSSARSAAINAAYRSLRPRRNNGTH